MKGFLKASKKKTNEVKYVSSWVGVMLLKVESELKDNVTVHILKAFTTVIPA